MDFCSEDNACCVKYNLCEIGKLAVPPYDAVQHWAEPDIADAAAYLRRLWENRDHRETLARRGQETILTLYSPRRCGSAMRERLMELELL